MGAAHLAEHEGYVIDAILNGQQHKCAGRTEHLLFPGEPCWPCLPSSWQCQGAASWLRGPCWLCGACQPSQLCSLQHRPYHLILLQTAASPSHCLVQ